MTEPNIPAAGLAGLAAWVRNGGTVVSVSNAGIADEYDTPSTILSGLNGVTEQERNRIVWASATAVNTGQGRTLPNATGKTNFSSAGATPLDFTAQGVVGKLTATAPSVEHLATYADGSPAITSRAVGKGHALKFGWLPGNSYW